MSSTIDSRIVTMKFDNATFQKGVTGTLDLLSKLKTAISGLPSSAKGLSGLTAEAKKVDLSHVQNQTQGVSNAFSAMSVVAVTAIATVAHSVTTAGINMGKSLTISPISEGLSEYETNLNSIQTIMANTGLEGEKGLNKVQGALDELNHYSDKTIYNFSEMARNIGTFTAAGVELQPATEAIKGIANLAAVSGSSSQQASTAMYQLSQALAAGKVTLMDWNSVVNAGMGGQVLKDALMETARVHGVAVDDIVKQSGSFRDSISQGWITGDILTETLQKFTGDLSKAQLESMGYTEAQIEGIMKMGETATDAATKVKTASALINTLQETATSGWSKTWSLILGDFFEARQMFTVANDVLGGMLSESAKQRNKMFSDWNKMGGRYVAIEAISNAFNALLSVLKPIKDAFRDIFPPMTGERLYELTVMIRDFTEGLILSEGSMNAIKSIFRAIFGVLGIGVEIVKGVLYYFTSLIGLLTGGAGGALEFSGSLAEIVAQFAEWVLAGDLIGNFFDKLVAAREKVLGPLIDAFGEVLRVLAGWIGTGAEAAIEAIGDAIVFMTPYLELMAEWLQRAGDAVHNYLVVGFERLQPVLDRVVDGLERAGSAVRNYLINAFEKLKPVLEDVKDAIEGALGSLSGVGGSLGGAFGGLSSMFNIGDSADKAASGIDRVKTALSDASAASEGGLQSGLTTFGTWLSAFGDFAVKVGKVIWSALKWVGNAVKSEIGGLVQGGADYGSAVADFLGGIFSAVGDAIRNVSLADIIVALNTIIMAALGGGLARMLWQFGGFFKDIRGVLQSAGDAIESFASGYENLGKAAKNQARAEMILNMGIALGILAGALFILSTIDSEKLKDGLIAVALMLIGLSSAVIILEKAMPDKKALGSTLKLAGISIILVGLAAAMLLMAIALRVISKLDPEELKTGLMTLGAVLGGIVIATAILNKTGGATSLLAASIAIGILSVSLTLFAKALQLYAGLDMEMLKEGGLKIAAILIGLGLAARAFPASGAIAAAVAMAIMAGSMLIIAKALQQVSAMDAGDSWQSVLTLGGALVALALAAKLMSTSLSGAVAIYIIANALKVLAPVLILLGQQDLMVLAKGIGAIAVALAVFGVLGAVVGVGLGILGAGLLLIGVGLLAAGAGAMLFASAVVILASSGAAAVAVMKESGVEFVRAGGKMFSEFLRQVIKNIPLMGKAFRAFMAEGLRNIVALIPDFVVAGFKIIIGLLNGLDQNMDEMTARGVSAAVKFINGVADQADRLVDAGIRLVGKLLGAIAAEIVERAGELKQDAIGLAMDMINGLLEGFENGRQWVLDKVASLIADIPGPIKKIMGIASPSKVMAKFGGWISEGLGIGIRDGAPGVVKEADDMGRKTLEVLNTAMSGVADALAIDPNMSPVITPVLDLTKMANDASRISSMLDTQPIKAEVSYSAAAALLAEQEEAETSGSGGSSDGDVVFEQHLHSPVPLDSTTIYRNTRNQFAVAKEALKK